MFKKKNKKKVIDINYIHNLLAVLYIDMEYITDETRRKYSRHMIRNIAKEMDIELDI